MNLTTYLRDDLARRTDAAIDALPRQCQQTTTGPLGLKCENPEPHLPRKGCLYVHTYVPDGTHDDEEYDR